MAEISFIESPLFSWAQSETKKSFETGLEEEIIMEQNKLNIMGFCYI